MRGVALLVGLILVIALLVGLALFGVWRLMQNVEPTAARAWAMIATVLVPAALWAGWKMGRIEARGAIAGLHMGVAEVHTAAAKATDLRVTNIRRVKAAIDDTPPIVVLPDPGGDFRMRPQLPGDSVNL